LTGSSGVKQLEPFFFLHDALAAWILLNLAKIRESAPGNPEKRGFEKRDEIRIDTSLGGSRGHVFFTESHAHPVSTPPPSPGTAVSWFEDLPNGMLGDFLLEIKELLWVVPEGGGSTGGQ
jgi:hypothetical protein